MKEEVKEKIIKVAKYIVENEKTISETAEHFNFSESTVKKYINDKNNLISIDYNLYLKVKKTQMKIISEGNKKGGRLGSSKGTFKLNEWQIKNIMDEMILKDLTFNEAQKVFNIPSSTIFEAISRYEKKENKTKDDICRVVNFHALKDNHMKQKNIKNNQI